MKNFLSLLLFGLTMTAMADGDLTVTFSRQNAILIPNPASTLSCEQISRGEYLPTTIVGGYFSLPAPEFSWGGDPSISSVQFENLVLEVESPYIEGGKHQCVYSSLALGNLFYKRNALGDGVMVNLWDGTLGRTYSRKISTRELTDFQRCDIKCGGIKLVKNAPKFQAKIKWRLLGVAKHYESPYSENHHEYPVTANGNLVLDNVVEFNK